jgi:hypothetical protein
MPVKLEFDYTDNDKESYEEEKKEENVKLTKDNYKDLFPTL